MHKVLPIVVIISESDRLSKTLEEEFSDTFSIHHISPDRLSSNSFSQLRASVCLIDIPIFTEEPRNEWLRNLTNLVIPGAGTHSVVLVLSPSLNCSSRFLS
jgi:hypothetical protein